MAFSNAKRCQAVSKRTGKQCGQPAVKGFDVCRFHGANADSGPGRPEGSKNPPASRKGGAPSGNINAVLHGAYSARLLPEEEPIYQEKRGAFTAALGEVDVFDEQIVHLLSLISTKVDQAVMKGAEHAAYAGMVKQILDLMRELKATRASSDPVPAGVGLTYADLVAALRAHIEGDSADGDGTNELPANGAQENSMEKHCSRCGFTTQHEPTDGDSWLCRNCGHIAAAIEDETPPDGGETGDEEPPAAGR
jgi:hypothetical protein